MAAATEWITFRRWVADIAAQHPNVQRHLFYEMLWSGAPGEEYYAGFMDIHQLPANTLLSRADYYVCGPAAFIRKQMQNLPALGVRALAIHFKEFGSAIMAL